MDFGCGIGPQRADFCLIFGSGESGKSSVSAERVKNGTCEPLAKLSTGRRNKLIKAPDKPVFEQMAHY
jgi:hypothetical protein